ncbi:unnamed protein product [Haemonchus placei]|uniref:BLM10_mid domain-containing protein n=1 Tax=Haemonchus placei TaxID=6290 RepID=A0A0N4WLD6_HAEPC|nr:unnamed protein product [Haemonchus placei]
MERVVRRTKNIRLRTHVVDAAYLPALIYVSGISTQREQDEQKSASFDALWEEYCSKFFDLRKCKGDWNPELRQRPNVKDAVAHVYSSLKKLMINGTTDDAGNTRVPVTVLLLLNLLKGKKHAETRRIHPWNKDIGQSFLAFINPIFGMRQPLSPFCCYLLPSMALAQAQAV